MLEWFMSLVGSSAPTTYGIIFIMLMGGALFLPIPEDLPLILSGILAQQGHGELLCYFLVCYIGIILGDLFLFFLGLRFGPMLMKHSWLKDRLSPSRMRRIKYELEKRSLWMILLARHLFYLRSVTFIKMRFYHFLVADALAALISAPLMIGIGYVAAEQYAVLQREIAWASYLVGAILLIAALVYIYFIRPRRKLKEQRGEL
jgi:membrane protein DedA with SNARE-associated domain